MHIEVSTDSNIDGTEGLRDHVRQVVEHALAHHHGWVTRVEVHLNDENAAKTGTDDKRCLMEARIQGRDPYAVSHHADSIHKAIAGAAEKLRRVTETTIAKMREAR